MRPIYESLALAAMMLRVSVDLKALVTDGENSSEFPIPAEVLDNLRVELIAPNVSGARNLIETGECTASGNTLSGELQTGDWIEGATYRLQAVATFGTQTQVIYALDITVPRYDELASEPQVHEGIAYVVITYGDGAGTPFDPSEMQAEIDELELNVASRADGGVYSKDGDGNAHITKPLSVSGSVQEGNSYGEVVELNVVVLTPEQKEAVEAETGTTYDYCDTNDAIEDGENVTIYADEECTQKVGSTAKTEYSETPIEGDFFNLQNGESISAGTYYARLEMGTMGINSHAEGNMTTASGISSHAEGNMTTAGNDYSHAEGSSTIASGVSSHAEGDNTTAGNDYSHAEGSSTTASGVSSHAEGDNTTAGGTNSHAEGVFTTASGDNSHAEGYKTIALQENQHVCGRFNVEDTNGDYALIVGNGTADNARSNAFAIDWNGNLVLFNAGTPVVLTPAKLATLIA